MIETTPDVSMNDTEAVETIKPSKPKNASKRVSKKPKIITVSVDNASIDFDQTTVEIKQREEPIEPVIEPVIEPKPKTKARSTPKKKPKATTVEQEAEVDSNNEVSHDVVDKPIIKETVSCPNCYKVMAPKTLKYNHKHTCPAKDKTAIVNSQTEPPVIDHFKVLADEVFEKAVEEKIKQIRKSKDNRKKDKFQDLVTQAL
jgi:hypothetical protein